MCIRDSDNAIQRRSADMKAAGINPLMAAGAAAQSSAPIAMKAPEISDFGGAFVSGKQAETQVKAQEVQGKIADQTINNLKTTNRILNIEEAQKANDLLLNLRRDTRSIDNSGLVNQIIQGADHAAQLLQKSGITNMARHVASNIFSKKTYSTPKMAEWRKIFMPKPDQSVQSSVDKTSEATRSGKLK